MIDYVKFDVSYLRKFDWGSTDIQFMGRGPFKGRATYPIEGNIRNLKIMRHHNRIYLEGSLHKFYNVINGQGKQNYNYYSLEDLKKTFDYLGEKIGFEPSRSKVIQLEYGFNLISKYIPMNVLSTNLVCHNKTVPNRNENYSNKGKYKQFSRKEYYIKFYDKRNDKNCNNTDLLGTINLFRFEKKVIRSRYLRGCFGIRWASDLLISKIRELLAINLLAEFDKLLIIDGERPKMKKTDRNLFTKCNNPLYWDSHSKQIHRSSKNRNFNKIMELVSTYNLDKIKQELRNELIMKVKTCNKWHHQSGRIDNINRSAVEIGRNKNLQQLAPYI